MNTPDDRHDDSDLSALEVEVRDALRASRRDSFADGFEDRALARWNRERHNSSNTFTFIERRALQFVPLAVAASLLLAVYSAQRHAAPGSTFIARTLGWNSTATSIDANSRSVSTTYESVYSELYGLPLTESSSGPR